MQCQPAAGNEPNPEKIERHLREGKIVKMEQILAGTGYWGLAEGEFANAAGDEKDPKKKKEMTRRYPLHNLKNAGASGKTEWSIPFQYLMFRLSFSICVHHHGANEAVPHS